MHTILAGRSISGEQGLKEAPHCPHYLMENFRTLILQVVTFTEIWQESRLAAYLTEPHVNYQDRKLLCSVYIHSVEVRDYIANQDSALNHLKMPVIFHVTLM
jgi:hypothetical protein